MRRASLLVLLTLVLAGCAAAPSDKPPLPSAGTTPATTSTTTPATSTPVVPQDADIIIKGFAFTPATYDEGVNGTVSWRNDDATTHTVTADDGSFDSGNVAPGARFEFTGAKVGTIPYHCKIHANMHGSVTFVAPTPPTTPTPPTPTPTPTPTTPSGANLVTIQGFAFHPTALNVHVGDTVTWQNADSAGHTSTSDTNVWDTGRIASDGAGSFTFTAAGTFPYHCAIHSSMKGTITVT